MSTTGNQFGASTSGDETQVHARVTASDAASAAAKMRDGAMARTAQGRDLAARKARALRTATAGLAAGSAAGATAGRSGQSGQSFRSGAPGGTARTGAAAPRSTPRRGGPRRVRLTAQRIDPWSVLKISFLVSVALGIAGVVMVAVLWTVLSGMNVFSTISDFFVQVTSGESGGPSFDLMDYLGIGRVISLAAVVGVLNVFLLTALATLTAFLYNICAALVGGAQITLSDE
ncbi:DUF3566 domain-containing protein [Ornithinimicrobium tianjinense]|uniref:DUF3566 domain-containing protein n=1 Tax=Ornithinimicrobium tianjinense TaxID=1195761 RepID=A0A917F8F1_9MICO|nr:DUF3566 domain-containing protein [Ornithinimicrobium tianjinense]GGF53145.1 hypothetical protein GCM10011366_21150 [Ornithinimicrobium tianjinense]